MAHDLASGIQDEILDELLHSQFSAVAACNRLAGDLASRVGARPGDAAYEAVQGVDHEAQQAARGASRPGRDAVEDTERARTSLTDVAARVTETLDDLRRAIDVLEQAPAAISSAGRQLLVRAQADYLGVRTGGQMQLSGELVREGERLL